ncbi:MAG: thioredoxin domain-containing protein [Alphaproteobacteria bacterium]|nr:thioredoxin domain-containing protein [Alphaproteobacteria bacterium]
MIITRRTTLLLGAGALAAACSGGGGTAAVSAGDMLLAARGAENAPLLIEYASLTCPHCASFHAGAWPEVKANYIDTGRLRFAFREYPTPPVPVAVAGFQVARCGGASTEQYYDRLSVLFAQQRQIIETGSYEGVRGKLIDIGRAAGLSAEQVEACIADEAGSARIRQVVEDAQQFNITGTPTFLLNGERLEVPGEAPYEAFAAAIDAKLSA